MSKARVIVVDDSAFMRKLIADLINEDQGLEVIARLRNGQELIDKVDDLDPDIVTLDLEMPILDGLATLKELKRLHKKINIIMLSSLTRDGSKYTMECLEHGAIDFVKKPSGSISLDIHKISKPLLEKIHGIIDEKDSIKQSKVISIDNSQVKTTNTIKAIVIGASTGGPKALQEVLTKIDKDIGVPIFVVQHMPSGFTKAFAERLDGLCSLKVVEAQNGMNIMKNTVYIAQAGYHMVIGNNNRIVLNDEASVWGVRPAVDKLFDSAIKVYGENLLSVILTGMGRDGAKGTKNIKDAGGTTISEAESTCIIYGMPKAAYETGKVDMVLSLECIPNKINELMRGR